MCCYAFLSDELCSCDLIVTSLVIKLIGAWFLDSELSTCSELKKLPTYMKKCFSVEPNPGPPVLHLHTHVDNPSNNYTCGILVGCLYNIPQTNYYLTPTYINNKLLHGMPSVVAFYYQLYT